MVIAAAEVDALQGVVAIGASAGGVEALSDLAAGRSPDVPYTYLKVLHVPAGAPSILVRTIDCSGPLPASAARAGTGLLARRDTAIAEETERALTLLSDRLSTTAQEAEAG